MLQNLHHVAYRCADVGATADFYTNVLLLRLAHIIVQDCYSPPKPTARTPMCFLKCRMAAISPSSNSPPRRGRRKILIHRTGSGTSRYRSRARPPCSPASIAWKQLD